MFVSINNNIFVKTKDKKKEIEDLYKNQKNYKFKEKDKDLEVLYIGTHNRMEKDLIPKYGIKYIPIEIYGISKTKDFIKEQIINFK